MFSLLPPTQNIILNFCWIWYNASNLWQLAPAFNTCEFQTDSAFLQELSNFSFTTATHCPWSLMEPNLLNHFFSPHHSFTQGLQKEEEQKGDLLRCLRRLPSPFTPPGIWLWEGQSQWLLGRIWELLPLPRAVARARRKRASNICQPPWELQPGMKDCWLVVVEMHAKWWEIPLERRGKTRETNKGRRHPDSTCCECQRTSLQHCLCWLRLYLLLRGAGSLLFLHRKPRHISLCSRNSLPVLATDVFHPVSSLPANPASPGRQNTMLICYLVQNQVLCHAKALGFFKLSLQSQGEVRTASFAIRE